MTRPIFEPTTQRVIRSQAFGSDQLFRRPAPATGSVDLDVIHMYNWDYTTTNTVATATWTSICGLGGSDGFFQDVFHSTGWSTGWNCASGNINLAVSAEYLLQGWVQFIEDANVGEQRFVAINFGSSNRHIQEFVADANSYLNLSLHLPVHTFYFGTSATCEIQVWHDHGSNLTFRGAEFSAKRFTHEDNGTIESC